MSWKTRLGVSVATVAGVFVMNATSAFASELANPFAAPAGCTVDGVPEYDALNRAPLTHNPLLVTCPAPSEVVVVNNDLATGEQVIANAAEGGLENGVSHPICDEYYEYKPTSRHINRIVSPYSDRYSNYNGTASNAHSTFTAGTSTTTTASFEASFSVTEGIIFAGVEETYKVNVSHALTASSGDSITVTTPPHTWSHGYYGVWEVVTDGHYIFHNSYCNAIDKGNVRAYSPLRTGWYAYNTTN